MLQARALVAALRAAGALPQSVTRRIGAPSNYQRHQRHRCVVQTLLAIDPGPAVAALKLPKRRTCPRRLALGVRSAASRQSPRHCSGIEVGRLAAHGESICPRRLEFLERQIRATADALFSPSGRSLLSTKVTQLYGVRPYLRPMSASRELERQLKRFEPCLPRLPRSRRRGPVGFTRSSTTATASWPSATTAA